MRNISIALFAPLRSYLRGDQSFSFSHIGKGVKPLSKLIGNTRGVSGITILGDGEVVPVLDVNTIA